MSADKNAEEKNIMGQRKSNVNHNCACCGRLIPKETYYYEYAFQIVCSLKCQEQLRQIDEAKKTKTTSVSSNSGNTSTASKSNSGSGLSAGDAAALAGAGIGAAAAGAGAALKGIGAFAKGAGSLFGALGKGVGAAVEGTQKQFGATHSAEAEIIAINNKVFSSDPEEYKKEIWALFDKATSKPADPLRDTFVIKAAKKKLIHELDVCKLKNPEMFSQFANLYEELTKKKKLFGLFG